MKFHLLFSAAIAAVIATACGSSDSNGSSSSNTDPVSACQGAATALCNRAFDCAGDGTARIVEESDGGGGASLDSASKQDCLTLYSTFGCANGGDASVDYGKCTAEIGVASCGTDGVGKKGVVSPASCAAKH